MTITAAAPNAASPWVELTNPCTEPIALDETVLRWSGEDYGWGAEGLAGSLAPGACMLVTNFDQPLLPGEPEAAGLALFSVYDNALVDLPSDEVIYGDDADVPAPSASQRIELVDGAWVVAEGARSSCFKKSPDVLRACAPDPDMCQDLTLACAADGLDKETCIGLGENLCPGNRYFSCEAAEAMCEQNGKGGCKHIKKICDHNLEGCPAPTCMAAGELSAPQAVAFCVAHPARFEQCGAEPSVTDCMSLMTWSRCGVTTCEWQECMDDLAALGNQCPVKYPASCAGVVDCHEAEG